MKFQLRWHVFLNAKNEKKAQKLIRLIEKTLELEASDIKIEPYWKDRALIESQFITEYHGEMVFTEAIYKTLKKINSIGTPWSVYTPKDEISEFDNVLVCSFEGICSSPRITGVTWVQFILETNTKLEYGWNH